MQQHSHSWSPVPVSSWSWLLIYSADVNWWNVSMIFSPLKECARTKCFHIIIYLFIYFKEKVKTSLRAPRISPCSAGVKMRCLLCWQQFSSNRPSYKPLKNTTLPLHGGTCHSLVFKHTGCTPHISQLSEIFPSGRQLASLPIPSHPIPSKHTFSTRQESRVKPPFLFFSFLLLPTSVNTL